VAPDMLESQSRALKARIIAWYPKNLSQKMAHWVALRVRPLGGAQGQATLAKKTQNNSNDDVTDKKTLTQNLNFC